MAPVDGEGVTFTAGTTRDGDRFAAPIPRSPRPGPRPSVPARAPLIFIFGVGLSRLVADVRRSTSVTSVIKEPLVTSRATKEVTP